jgi:hypothetical protein
MICRHVNNSLRNKRWKGTFHNYLRKWFFWPAIPLGHMGKISFLSPLNVTILQTVRDECVRFGRHVDIEVSYEILWLELLKEAQFCSIHLTFSGSYFEVVLIKKSPLEL